MSRYMFVNQRRKPQFLRFGQRPLDNFEMENTNFRFTA